MKQIVSWIAPMLLAANAYAHDPAIHNIISKNAVTNSVLNDVATLEQLGLKGVDPNSQAQLFFNMATKLQFKPFTISGLVQFGAEYEDERRLVQAVHHFFNPLTGAALTVGGYAPGETSPDWALEDRRDYGNVQPFSYRSARNYFYNAVTSGSKISRDKYWGGTFQTLGHVIHHIQDMTQPQHTRNDAHCPAAVPCLIPGSLFGLYSPSSYENWNLAHNPPEGIYKTYGKVDASVFTTPRKFWTSTNGNGTSGKGIAEYTHRGFFSAGTLPPNLNFPSPVIPLGNVQSDLDIAVLCQEDKDRSGVPCPEGLEGKMSFYSNTVTDNLAPAATRENKRALTASIFDADLEGRNYAPILSLNRFNFVAVNEFMMPRAVSYSSGLIDYFFRGRIDLTPDPADGGKYIISNLSAEPMKGTFTLYYDDIDETRRLVEGGTWENVEIAANSKQAGFSFAVPTDPAPKKLGEYMLVFQGNMGEETTANGNLGAVVASKIAPRGMLVAVGLKYGSGSLQSYLSPDLGNSWFEGGQLSGNGAVSYIGNNSVLGSQALSVDGARSWATFPRPDQITLSKRLNVAEIGDNRLIGSYVTNTSPAEVGVAFSSDKGVTWHSEKRVDGATFNVSRPVYMGNNRLVMKSFYSRGNIPCPYRPTDLCESFGSALFSSTDGGSSWSNIADQGNMGLLRITYLGKTKPVNGVLKSDPHGADTLFAHGYDLIAERTHRPKFVRSLDGGVTWEETGFPAEMRDYSYPEYNDLWGLTYIGNGTMLAYFHNNNYPARHFLYKSTDYGATWTSTGKLPNAVLDPGVYSLIFVGDTKTISNDD